MLYIPASYAEFVLWLGSLFLCILIAFPVVAKLAAILNRLTIRHRLLKNQTIIAEYIPPQDLNPYELGYLYDRVFSDNELFAALLIMAQQDDIDMDLANLRDITVTAKALSEQKRLHLNGSEQSIYTALVETYGGTKVSWRVLSSVSSETAGMQNDFEAAVIAELYAKGYLHQGSMFQAMQERRIVVAAISLLLTTGLVYLPLSLLEQAVQTVQTSSGYQSLDSMAVTLLLGLLAVAVWPCIYLYCQLLAHIYFRAAGLPAGSTPQLRSVWPQIVGHRLYVQTIGWPKLQPGIELIDELLPYCAAYGLYLPPTQL